MLMDDSIIEYRDRVVAFIDILGFERLIRSLSNNPKLFARLNFALRRIKYIEKSRTLSNSITSDLEVSVFSDSVAISTKEERIFSLVWTVGWLQAELMYVGVLTRGGISVGPTIHEDGILYGEGMLSAYHLESKAAVYPRIVIANDLARKHEKLLKNWIVLDADSVTYVNPFKFDAVAGGADELAADGYDPRAVYFQEVRKHLINGIATASEEDHLAKYRWLANRFNVALADFNKSSLEKISAI